jgi:hypothetical protein
VTGATLISRGAGWRGQLGSAPSLFDGARGEPTLDELLAGVWEGLTAHRVVSCPVCRADMRPEYGAHSLPVGGRCQGCGATLS